jgi:hypothetical protein
MKFTLESVKEYLAKQRKVFNGQTPPVVTEHIPDAIKKSLEGKNPFNEWHNVQSRSEKEQQDLWIFREWLQCEMGLYVASKTLGATGPVQFGANPPRTPPTGFNITDYNVLSFGSQKVTSDIDITIEGAHSSFVVACLEDAWYELTGKTSRIWDIEYYGDFLMFHKSFLNSRTFSKKIELSKKLLTYVGVGIRRNHVRLDDPAILDFINKHPELADNGWIQEANDMYADIENETEQQYREHYYKALDEAEDVRESGKATETVHMDIFRALALANIYRYEGYILPSTVIHVVRDIQAHSEVPRSEKCQPFMAKLATCALGRFTYLCSALEQMGYMLRFRDMPAKVQKYSVRLDDALLKAKAAATGGGRSKLSTRRRSKYGGKKKTYSKGAKRGRMGAR